MPKYLNNTGVGQFKDIIDASVGESLLPINDTVATIQNDIESIESNYVRSFDTVAEMQAATDLQAGMTCHTNGNATVGDGGAAYYTVGSSGDIALQGGLYASEVNISLSNAAIDEITDGGTPSSDGLVDDTGLAHFWDNIQDKLGDMSLNVSPSISYEGVVDVANYSAAACAHYAGDTFIQIFSSNASGNGLLDGVYKIVQLGTGFDNKVISSGTISQAGHANCAFTDDDYLYVLSSDTVLSKYDKTSIALVSQVTLSESIGFVGYDTVSGNYYCCGTPTLSDGTKPIVLYTLDITTGACTLVNSNILPDEYQSVNPPLRNDGYIYDGNLCVSICGSNGTNRYSTIFVYNLETGDYGAIAMPTKCYAFNIVEIEGLAINPNTRRIYLASSTNYYTAVFGSFQPYTSINRKFSDTFCMPNVAADLATVRAGDLAETTCILQTGNSATPFTSLDAAIEVVHFLDKPRCNIQLVSNMTLANTYSRDGFNRIELNKKTLTVGGNGTLTVQHGMLYISDGTFVGSISQQRTAILSMNNVDMSNGTITAGRAMAVLVNVTNVTITDNGNMGLIFRSGTTPTA